MKSATSKTTGEAIVEGAQRQETDIEINGYPIPCHYCDQDIQTIDSKELMGFFWLFDGKFTIINHDGDKEAVCNKCLEKY